MSIDVVIVDDSAVVRASLQQVLSRVPGIRVVGTAPDPFGARDKIVKLQPDVLLLDIEMPGMDGLTFLRKLMVYHPIPVIIVSSLTPTGSQRALEALEAGAFDVVCKPGRGDSEVMFSDLIEKIRSAARSRSVRRRNVTAATAASPIRLASSGGDSEMLIVIGASTGGTQALQHILAEFPADAPATIVVQHMPQLFTRSFAHRLDQSCAIDVREAADGELVNAGTALVVPGGSHAVMRRSGNRWRVSLNQGPNVMGHRPSVDVLFKSAARAGARKVFGVILTGMGSDGAQGLRELRDAGATTIAQDEATCVVFGMPGAAVRLDAAEHILPLERIATVLMQRVASAPRGEDRVA